MKKRFLLKSVLATVLACAVMLSNICISGAAEIYEAGFFSDENLVQASKVKVELGKPATLKYEGKALTPFDLKTGKGDLMCIMIRVDIPYDESVSLFLDSLIVNGKSYSLNLEHNIPSGNEDLGFEGTFLMISDAVWRDNIVDFGIFPKSITSIEATFTVTKDMSAKAKSSSVKKLNTPEISVKRVDEKPVIELTKWSKFATHFALYRINPRTSKYEDIGYKLSPGKAYTDTAWNFAKNKTAKYKARAVILSNSGAITAISDLSEKKTVSFSKPLPTPTFEIKVSSQKNPIIELKSWPANATYYGVYRLSANSGKYVLVDNAEFGKAFTDTDWNLQKDGGSKYKVQAFLLDSKGDIFRKSELSSAVSVKAISKEAISRNGLLIKVGDYVRNYNKTHFDVGGIVTKVVGDQVTFRIDYYKPGTYQAFAKAFAAGGIEYGGQIDPDDSKDYESYEVGTTITLSSSELNRF